MRIKRHALLLIAICAFIEFSASAASAQNRPQFKGVFESVSHEEDIEFLDVFFVNAETGWVSGAAGTILKTTDAGKSWVAQLGGDPADRAEPIAQLRFVDEHHGWAVQDKKLLRTTDGESWEEIGTVPPGMQEIVFTSRTAGFAAAAPTDLGAIPTMLWRTRDGGKTWQKHWACGGKLTLDGLATNLGCMIRSIQFVTPRVGHAVVCAARPGCDPPSLLARTEDGGETWEVMVGPGVVAQDFVTAIFFTDEQTGFARLYSEKLHVTNDGGKTWRGLVASPGPWLRFADPQVGWAYNIDYGTYSSSKLTFTTDGGKRWSARPLTFPAITHAMSMPRRDRAYIVGKRGMIYRYSVVPAARALGPNDIAAPAMPAFATTLAEEAEQLEQVIGELSTALGVPAGGAADKASGDATSDAASDEALDTPLPPASQFAAQCCGQAFSKLEAVLGALATTLPDFIGQYKNLNLLLAGLRISADLPAQYRDVKSALKAFRTATDKEGAQAALVNAAAAVRAFKQNTEVATQQELPEEL